MMSVNLQIYQIDTTLDENLVKFCSLAETINFNKKVNSKIYRKVFDGEVNCKNNEEIFQKFNTDIPTTHIGHSLSISDVIEADGEFFFCDKVGFEKIDFDSKQAPKEDLLKMLVIEPHKEPYVAHIKNDYKTFQKVVEGCFECIYLDENCMAFCNDEGKLLRLDGNRMINQDIIAGNFFIASGDSEGNTVSLNDSQIEYYKERFKELEQYTPEQVENDIFMEFISF